MKGGFLFRFRQDSFISDFSGLDVVFFVKFFRFVSFDNVLDKFEEKVKIYIVFEKK